MAMYHEIKQKWVAALRSGDYKQGTGRLRQMKNGETQFCCLGVLCNLHAIAHPEIAAKETDPCTYMNSATMPPFEVFEWAGLSQIAKVKIGHYDYLDGHNDTTKATFAQLADAIERDL